MRPQAINARFDDGMAKVREQFPKAFATDSPLFVLIDPFGAKGAPYELVGDILSTRCSEVLINLDSDGLGRIYNAADRADHENIFETAFGDLSDSS